MNNDKILRAPPKPIPPLESIGKVFFSKMLEHKEKIAHTDAITGETQTYELVLQRTIRTAIAMKALGVKPNDVITIWTPNILDCYVAFYASFFIGAISANLDPLISHSDAVHLLKIVNPKVVFVLPESIQYVEDALLAANVNAKIIVFGPTHNHISFDELLKPSLEEANFIPYATNDLHQTAVIVFTSGSTGLPKAACLTHYSLLGKFELTGTSAMTVLVFSNLYWIAAPCFSVFAIQSGSNRLVYPRYKEGDNIWNIIKTYKVNIISINPHQALDICKYGRPKDANITSLLHVAIPGGCVTSKQIEHIRKCFNFPKTWVSLDYGQTELAGAAVIFSKNPFDIKMLINKPLSVGRPIPGNSYKIVDIETNQILGPNQKGELLIKTDFIMNGYYGMDSSACWDSDGYFKTGDLAYYDEDQCFFIVDRIKDLMKYRMWHISPVQLENVLLTHPAVKDCIVSSRLHPVDGDHLIALVVLKAAEGEKVTKDELEKYFNSRVGDYQKLRAGIKFVENIPYTASDKINRIKIKQLLLTDSL